MLVRTALSASATAALFATAPEPPRIEFGVDAGIVIVKELAHELDLELVDGVMVREGREEPMPQDMVFTVHHEVSARVRDAYGPLAGHRSRTLVRTIEEHEDRLEANARQPDGGKRTQALELESPLAGEALRWTLDEEGGRYRVAPDDEESELDRGLLAGLVFDLDGYALVPTEGADLEQGATLSAAALAELLVLGGDVHGAPSGPERDDGESLLRAACLVPCLGELEGEAVLRLVEVDRENGLAVLRLEGELEGETEAGAFATRLTEGLDLGSAEFEAVELETELELEGVVVWNTGQGRLERFDLDATVLRSVRALLSLNDQEAEIRFEFEGEASWEYEVESVGR